MIHTRAVGKAAKLISVCGSRFSLTNVRPLRMPSPRDRMRPCVPSRFVQVAVDAAQRSDQCRTVTQWTKDRSVAASTPNAGGEVCLALSTSLPGPERCRNTHRRCQCERSAPRVMTTGTIGSLARTRRPMRHQTSSNQYNWGTERGRL